MTAQTGLLLISHGSRSVRAAAEFDALAAQIRGERPDLPVEAGYLELAEPSLEQCLERLIDRGLYRILAVPVMLFPALHVAEDIPGRLAHYQQQHPAMHIQYGVEIGKSEKLIDAARNALVAVAADQADRLVLLVKGASNPAIAARAQDVLGALDHHFGYASTRLAFSGDKPPGLEEVLEEAVRDGISQVAVCPYFLFSGRLLDCAAKTVERFRRTYAAPDIRISGALYNQAGVRAAILEQLQRFLP